jgi:AcrR family transcriptional regulator
MDTSPRKTTRSRSLSPKRKAKNEQLRLQILVAAAKLIGRYGYAGCTISRVAAKTKIAHGSFYYHFKSRQHMLDQVLPTIAAQMMDEMGHAIKASENIEDLERRGFTANAEEIEKRPYMSRVWREAELHAPVAYAMHMDNLTSHYVKSLRRTFAKSDLSEQDLTTLAKMLVGARDYILLRSYELGATPSTLSERTKDLYIKFVAGGLKAVASAR